MLLLLLPGGGGGSLADEPQADGPTSLRFYELAALGVALAVLLAGPAIHLARLLGVGLSFGELAHVGWAELWTVSAAPLAVCLAVSVAVIVICMVLSPNAWPRRPLRRALNGLLLAALVFLLFEQDFTGSQRWELIPGIVLAVVFFHHLVDRGLGKGGWAGAAKAVVDGFAETRGSGSVLRWVRIAPWLALAWAIGASLRVESGLDRTLLVGPAILLGAALFTAPWSVARSATRRTEHALRAPRAALAATGLGCIVALIAREEPALLLTATAGAAMVALCTWVAGGTADRFAPFAVALGASIFAFAGVAAALENARSPKISPVAFVTKEGELVCGGYVGERNGRLTYARLTPVARPKLFRAGVSSSATETVSLGQTVDPIKRDRLQALSRAMRRAAQLGGELATGQQLDGRTSPAKPSPACARPARASAGGERPIQRVAKRFQPTFQLDGDDLFWPVNVDTVFSLEGRDGSVCLRREARRGCARLVSADDLPRRGESGDFISFPERLNRREVSNRVHEVLGADESRAPAVVYFVGSGPRGDYRTTSIQYWTYYVYNYLLQRLPVVRDLETGAHLSDFVGLVLSASRQPRYVFMSRHKAENEGRAFNWEDAGLERLQADGRSQDGSHVLVAVAEGSHANYERCGRQPRDAEGAFQIIGVSAPFDDHADCGGARLAAATPLIDLAREPWACWPGRYGRGRLGLLERTVLAGAITEGAPPGPFKQQRFGGSKAPGPCAAVGGARNRGKGGNAALPRATADALSARAGRIERWVDDCDDWTKPPCEGALVVACPTWSAPARRSRRGSPMAPSRRRERRVQSRRGRLRAAAQGLRGLVS